MKKDRTGRQEAHMYAIVGATGHTGGIVAEKLLAKGEKVRVIGRDPNHLTRFTALGAEAFAADATDATAMTKAFSGTKAVYLMIPPNAGAPDVRAFQNLVSDALTLAVKTSGVPYAVLLSSVGADKPDKTGPVVGLHEFEEKLNAIAGIQALYLRPGYFMENVLAQTGVVQNMGMLAGPLSGDLPVAMIATRDIGDAAAEALLQLHFIGKTTRELLGPRDVTYDELAKIIGTAIEKPGLAYHRMPGMLLKPALMKMGLSSSMVDGLLEMSDSLNSGYMKALEPRTPMNTTPTTIETFIAEVFIPAYRGQSARA
jgi:uncharacterized protein YbjT (DUF2867 family)